MRNAGVWTSRVSATRATLPLAALHEALPQFLHGRVRIAFFGAQAVNA